MPIFEFTFLDTSTTQVLAPDAAAALTHVEELLHATRYQDNGFAGKTLASPTARVVDKFAEREALNKAARG